MISASDRDDCRNCDIAPALQSAVTLLETVDDDDRLADASRMKLLEATGVIKAPIVADTTALWTYHGRRYRLFGSLTK